MAGREAVRVMPWFAYCTMLLTCDMLAPCSFRQLVLAGREWNVQTLMQGGEFYAEVNCYNDGAWSTAELMEQGARIILAKTRATEVMISPPRSTGRISLMSPRPPKLPYAS